MITAFVLIQARPELIAQTGPAIAELPGVAEVYSVTGEWDMIAILRLGQFEDLDQVVTQGLRGLPGIVRTQTLLAFRAYPNGLLEQGFNIGQD